MRTLLLGAATTMALFGASLGGGAQAAPAGLISGVYQTSDAPSLVDAQFLFGGRNYCWYAIGWRGPGYYWCGYAERRGLGWGGGDGWNGWHGGGHGGGRGGHMGGHMGGGRGAAAMGGHGGGGHMGGARAAVTGGHGGGHAGGGHVGGGHVGGGGHGGGGHAGGGGGGHKHG